VLMSVMALVLRNHVKMLMIKQEAETVEFMQQPRITYNTIDETVQIQRLPEQIQLTVSRMILAVSLIFILSQLNSVALGSFQYRQRMFGYEVDLSYFFLHFSLIIFQFVNNFCYIFYDRFYRKEFLKTLNFKKV
jgi:hypothetical protein